MTTEQLKEILEAHEKWLNDEEGGEEANLRDADLRYADLCGADLCGANLDFSCLPLWRGSLAADFDDRQIIQLIYHAVKAGLSSKNTSNEVKEELSKLKALANKFHRVNEYGIID